MEWLGLQRPQGSPGSNSLPQAVLLPLIKYWIRLPSTPSNPRTYKATVRMIELAITEINDHQYLALVKNEAAWHLVGSVQLAVATELSQIHSCLTARGCLRTKPISCANGVLGIKNFILGILLQNQTHKPHQNYKLKEGRSKSPEILLFRKKTFIYLF